MALLWNLVPCCRDNRTWIIFNAQGLFSLRSICGQGFSQSQMTFIGTKTWRKRQHRFLKAHLIILVFFFFYTLHLLLCFSWAQSVLKMFLWGFLKLKNQLFAPHTALTWSSVNAGKSRTQNCTWCVPNSLVASNRVQITPLNFACYHYAFFTCHLAPSGFSHVILATIIIEKEISGDVVQNESPHMEDVGGGWAKQSSRPAGNWKIRLQVNIVN